MLSEKNINFFTKSDKHFTKRTATAPQANIHVPLKAYELVTFPYPVERSEALRFFS